MPGKRVGHRSFGRSGNRAKTSWQNLAFTFSITAVASQQFSDLTPEPMATSGEGTALLKRTILSFEYFQDDVASITPNSVVVGFAVVTADAFAAGALPDPVADSNQDWLYWTRRSVQGITAIGQATPNRWEADIRSMRRLRGGYKLVMIIENQANQVASSLEVAVRTLWVKSP